MSWCLPCRYLRTYQQMKFGLVMALESMRHLAAHEIAKKIVNNQWSVLIDVDAGEG